MCIRDSGIIAVRQGRDEVMAAGSFGGGHHLLVGGIGAAEFDIVPVSYTHLDVYKRQALCCTKPEGAAKYWG